MSFDHITRTALERATAGIEGARHIGSQLSGYAGTNVQTLLEAIIGRVLPSGGTTGQALTKSSGTDYAVGWTTASGASPPFADNTALVKDDADATKLIRVDAGTVATGTTRVLTMPNADVNLTADQAAGTASIRTIGTGALQAAAGNDSRFSDTRTPTDATVTPAKEATAVSFVEIVTTAQRNTLSSPKKGKVVFDTDIGALFVNYGTSGSPTWRYVGPPHTMAFSKASTATGSFGQRWYLDQNITIVGYYITLGTIITSGTLTVDLDRATNAAPQTLTSIYTTTGNRPSITSATNTDVNAWRKVAGAVPDTVDIPSGDFLLPRIAVAPTGGANAAAFIKYVVRP